MMMPATVYPVPLSNEILFSVLLTEVVGLYLAAMIYLLAYIKIVGGYRWRTVLLVSIPIPLIFYWVFEKIFLIPMPAGMFGAQILRF